MMRHWTREAFLTRRSTYAGRRVVDLLEAQGAEALLKRMRLAYKAHRNDRDHQSWQEGSHPQGIEGEAMLRQKPEHIH